MNLSRTLSASLVAMTVLCMAMPAEAGMAKAAKAPNRAASAAKPAPKASAAETLATANALVRYGDANKDALALITAARMINAAGASDSKDAPVGRKPGTKAEKAGEPRLTVEAILQRARALAANRADLLALADDVSKSSSRGGVNGPSRHVDVVMPRSIDTYTMTFEADDEAIIAVSGDGDTDLDLYVYDEGGHEICKDVDATDDMLCRFTPAWTGTFTVKIKNLGTDANRYLMIHN